MPEVVDTSSEPSGSPLSVVLATYRRSFAVAADADGLHVEPVVALVAEVVVVVLRRATTVRAWQAFARWNLTALNGPLDNAPGFYALRPAGALTAPVLRIAW